MHGQSFYDETRAMEIFEAVRALLRHLSTKLAEQNSPGEPTD